MNQSNVIFLPTAQLRIQFDQMDHRLSARQSLRMLTSTQAPQVIPSILKSTRSESSPLVASSFSWSALSVNLEPPGKKTLKTADMGDFKADTKDMVCQKSYVWVD